ncbi:hypothetical protein ACFLZZ_01150 [Nanoarchaeota archaeon]
MKKNENLEFLAKEIAAYLSDKREVANKIKEDPLFAPFDDPLEYIFNKTEYASLDLAIEKFANEHNIDLQVDVIREGAEIGELKAKYDSEKRLCIYDTIENRYFKYGKVIVMDGLPALVEMKMKKFYKKTSKGVKRHIHPRVYLERMKRVAPFFKTTPGNMGYLVIVPNHLGFSERYPNKALDDFRRVNGIIAQHRLTRIGFLKEVEAMIQLHGLSKSDYGAHSKKV